MDGFGCGGDDKVVVGRDGVGVCYCEEGDWWFCFELYLVVYYWWVLEVVWGKYGWEMEFILLIK